MKRRTRTTKTNVASADDSTLPAEQHQHPITRTDTTENEDSNGTTASASITDLHAEGATEQREYAPPGGARVTRERALFFATGQRVAATTSTSVKPAEKESWPGYFNTARDLDEKRLAAQTARQEELLRKEREVKTSSVWIPRKKSRTTAWTHSNGIQRLQDLALQCLAKHIELLPTLEYIDSTARHQVAKVVVQQRRMKSDVLPLFIFPGVTEIDIPDCSNIDEDTFVRTLKSCLAEGLTLTILRLGLCGRCVSDSVIHDLGDSLRLVEQLKVQGCYRLSDNGCEALVRRCAPSLQEFELSCNQRITKQSINYFSELNHLQALTLSECPQLDDASLHALLSMKKLRKLALNQMERLSDPFIAELAQQLPELEELSLARCSQLTDTAVQSVLEACRGLKQLDLSDLHLLTDQSLEPIRLYGHPLQHVSIRCCIGLTDVALEHLAFGANEYLQVLEMSSVSEVTDATLLALQEFCASSLRTLDISFCRKLSEDALGIFTDAAENLTAVVLWGCTQITARFLTCHSRDALLITGHPLLTGLTVRH